MILPKLTKTFNGLASSFSMRFDRFRAWRWFWLSLIASALIIGLGMSAAVMHFRDGKSSIPSIFHNNPLTVISQAISGQNANHAGPSPASTTKGAPNSPSTNITAVRTYGQSTPAPTSGTGSQNPANHTLVLSSNTLTISSTLSNTSYWHPSAYITAPGDVALFNPEVTGSRVDIGIVVLPMPVGSGPSQYYPTPDPKWVIQASRNHFTGSGVSRFGISAKDAAGNIYTNEISVIWPPMPYFTVSDVTASLGTAADSIGDIRTSVILDFIVTGNPGSGSHSITMSTGLGYPYDCASNSLLHGTGTVTESPAHFSLSCILVGDNELERSNGGAIGVSVQGNDPEVDFVTAGGSTTAPKW